MGFVILADGLKMDPEKVKAILEWPTPENVGEIRSFHGLACFYRKFIKNSNVVCNAITETIRGDKKEFKWTHGTYESFETLKQKVSKLPVLALPEFNNVFQVECDTSGNAIGVVLSQEGKSFSFFSEKLNDAKRKYSMYDQVFYAIVQALKKWRYYLIPKDFVLYTDHKSLQYLESQHKFSQIHMKWVEYLQSFTFAIKQFSKCHAFSKSS